ncbi:hypothetical protein OIDMADRAFT_53995 [Oidiodendron maius Zn]|uniref:Ubiquinol-cytochrome-c reductase complex assembly factor 2 n=1 Tax=Oidiodendron maius (strain Zn) TaxID=913774 RepID=A0A0C3GXR2_OIDMZ|nr:hypothetical protein OIDMADRAFT_53995 [Oidiodendron maius Zn]
MSTSTVYKHYLRALSRWPKDALRPECQFQDVIRKRVDRRLLPSSPSTSTKSPSKLSSAEEKAEWEQVNALYSLLENRYSRKFASTGSLMRPASNPTYYADLVRELDEAPQRGWWERTKRRWKGMLRFS